MSYAYSMATCGLASINYTQWISRQRTRNLFKTKVSIVRGIEDRWSGVRKKNFTHQQVNRQPIAGLWPTFRLVAPAAASWSSRPCNVGRCAISCIHPNVPTHGPPTSSAGPRQPRERFADHRWFPANRVRNATAAGSVEPSFDAPIAIINLT